MAARLSPDQLGLPSHERDLTDPAEGTHAIQHVLDRAVEALADTWRCSVRWCRGPRVVTVEDNYDNLGYDPADVTRDERYTRYVDDRRMLRSHSSAMIPPALRTLTTEPIDDVLLVCPGMVYRRDSIDRLHTGTPHQLDLWRLIRGTRPLAEPDLVEMITALTGALLPGAATRLEPRIHPYTLAGRQVDVAVDDDWVEIAECGLAHPEALTRAGLDSSSWSGLALGMGLDRVLMLIKGIPDIRLLRSTNTAVAEQMVDLRPYRPVSSKPATRRDISIAVNQGDLVEDLGDRERTALGDDAAAVESVEILQETSCAELPARALGRLGGTTSQKNVLARITLRPLDRTLTDHAANVLRDRIYAALHQGSTHQWAVACDARAASDPGVPDQI